MVNFQIFKILVFKYCPCPKWLFFVCFHPGVTPATCTVTSTQPSHSGVVSSRVKSKTTVQKAKHQKMDKVMKRLGIELAPKGGNAMEVVHCNAYGKLMGGGRTTWLSALQNSAFKLNPIIDDIHR